MATLPLSLTVGHTFAAMADSFATLMAMTGLNAPCLGKPRGRHPIRPYSRSKYRPHSGPAEAARRARQIAKGMLQVSVEHVPVQHPEGRQVKPHRSGGATRMWTDDYDMAY